MCQTGVGLLHLDHHFHVLHLAEVSPDADGGEGEEDAGDQGEAQAHPAHDVRPAHSERSPVLDVLGPDRVEVQARVQNLEIREEFVS